MGIVTRHRAYDPEFFLKGDGLKMVDFHRGICHLNPSVGLGVKFLHRAYSSTPYGIQFVSNRHKRTFVPSSGLGFGRDSSPKFLSFRSKRTQKKKNYQVS
jgi:hypothetical protein